jgi:hypothetical protein
MFSPAGIIIYKGTFYPHRGTEEVLMLAFAPTLKMMICIALGYLITKKGAFPPQFAKGVGFISLVSLLVLFDILTTERRPARINLFVGGFSIHT